MGKLRASLKRHAVRSRHVQRPERGSNERRMERDSSSVPMISDQIHVTKENVSRISVNPIKLRVNALVGPGSLYGIVANAIHPGREQGTVK